MKTVVLHPLAEVEAVEAADWYERQCMGLGREFRLELESALQRVHDNPLLYGIDLEPCRACPLHRFPYTLHYLDQLEKVWVLAIAHQRRMPGYWVGRAVKT